MFRIYLFFLWLADWDRDRDRETERPLGADPDQERDLERLQTNKPELWCVLHWHLATGNCDFYIYTSLNNMLLSWLSCKGPTRKTWSMITIKNHLLDVHLHSCLPSCWTPRFGTGLGARPKNTGIKTELVMFTAEAWMSWWTCGSHNRINKIKSHLLLRLE